LVSPQGPQKRWELYDVKADPGEKNNVAAKHPEVVAELEAAYDRWWEQVLPLMVNEDAVGPKVNPFKEQYWKQFGEGPAESRQGVRAPRHYKRSAGYSGRCRSLRHARGVAQGATATGVAAG
jgi:hypothetical protein